VRRPGRRTRLRGQIPRPVLQYPRGGTGTGRGSAIPWPRINAFVEEIGAAGDDRGLIQGVMRSLDRLVGMDLPCVFALIGPEGRLVPERTVVSSRLWFERFRDRYWNRIPDIPGGSGARTTIVDWNLHLHTEYSADFMRPQHIRYSLGVVNIGGAGYAGTLALNRSSASRPFGEKEQELLEILQPHISNYYRILLAQGLREPATADAEARQAAALAERRRSCERLQEERGITDREWQIVEQVLAGCSNEEISRQLGISERTVEAHCVHVYNKLAIRNRRELFLLASERGLMPDSPLTDLRAARKHGPR
jgi:DNA-binding CsgD family transcriptional regulator